MPMPAPAPVNPRQAQLDAAARQAGYPSYEAMALFMAQRDRARDQQTVSGAGARGMPGSVSEAAQSMMAWHPATIFNKISEALRNATGGGQ